MRASSGKNMAEQAEAMSLQVAEISAIETGAVNPPASYIDGFSTWLNLSSEAKNELFRRVPRGDNVLHFSRKPTVTKSVRLFRKVSIMSPSQIRALKSELRKGAHDD
jgi:hypothetical protein